MKYKDFKLSQKEVWAIKTMMSNTDPSPNGSDDMKTRLSLLKKFGDFGQYYNNN
jgi:hypothetical protein